MVDTVVDVVVPWDSVKVTVVSYVMVVTGMDGWVIAGGESVMTGAEPSGGAQDEQGGEPAGAELAGGESTEDEPAGGEPAGGATDDGVGVAAGAVGFKGMYVGQSVMSPGFSGTCDAQIPRRY